jgi:hypothetical protein
MKGRIDHFGFDPTHNRLFVSALGNNTEEIIGISAQTVIHTISGVPTPQGVVFRRRRTIYLWEATRELLKAHIRHNRPPTLHPVSSGVTLGLPRICSISAS